MVERQAELSVEMRPFISLELARPFIVRFCVVVSVYELVILCLLLILNPLFNSAFFFLFIVVIMAVGALLIYRNSPYASCTFSSQHQSSIYE